MVPQVCTECSSCSVIFAVINSVKPMLEKQNFSAGEENFIQRISIREMSKKKQKELYINSLSL
jgi:hypothetical protein